MGGEGLRHLQRLQRGLQDLRQGGPGLRVQRRAGARPHLHGRQAERPGGQRRLQVHRDRARPRRQRQIRRLHRHDLGWPREVEISSLRSSRAQTCKTRRTTPSITSLPVCYVINSCCPPPPPPSHNKNNNIPPIGEMLLNCRSPFYYMLYCDLVSRPSRHNIYYYLVTDDDAEILRYPIQKCIS